MDDSQTKNRKERETMPMTTTQAHVPPDLKGKIIILVEDDNDTREFLVTVLERTGATVHAATDGLTAIDEIQRIAARNLPALIMLDFMLPGISGNDIIERLRGREELANIPLMVVTAFPESEELKGLTVLPKPPKVSDIYGKIREALGL